MSRPTSLLLAAAVATAVVGCAHCDTCDDFPAPCVDCGYSSPGPVGAPMYADTPFAPGMPMGSGQPIPMSAGQIVPMGTPMGQIPAGSMSPGQIVNPAPAPPVAPGSTTPSSPGGRLGTPTPTPSGNSSTPPANGSSNDLPPIPPPLDSGSPF